MGERHGERRSDVGKEGGWGKGGKGKGEREREAEERQRLEGGRVKYAWMRMYMHYDWKHC